MNSHEPAPQPDIVVIGGGGHARMLVDALQFSGPKRIAILDSDSTRLGSNVLGAPVIGDDALLATLAKDGTRFFAIGIGGTHDNALRARLFEHAQSLGLEPLTIVHPSAMVSRWASLGNGCQVMPGAIVNAGAQLGVNVIVNTAAVVEHDCIIGDHVHVATRAALAGGVIVGALAHVGAGAVVRQIIEIGRASVVGAGAAVVKNVRPGAIVVGVPAKELNS